MKLIEKSFKVTFLSKKGVKFQKDAFSQNLTTTQMFLLQIEVDGKKSVRSLTGLRRDSEVMYVGTYDTNAIIDTKLSGSQQNLQPMIVRRGRISDVWGTLNKARSTPDLLGDRCLEEEEEEEGDDEDEDDSSSVVERNFPQRRNNQLQEPGSIFNRPGFGSVAFRRSVSLCGIKIIQNLQ